VFDLGDPTRSIVVTPLERVGVSRDNKNEHDDRVVIVVFL
jgi:hypothetical protein